jgi:AraC-like DNA-binding protein
MTTVISETACRELAAAYKERWAVTVYATRPDGSVCLGRPPCPDAGAAGCRDARAFAVAEALRWGEPTVEPCPAGRLLWAVPLMCNQQVTGGLVASTTEERVLGRGGVSPLDVRQACEDLRRMAEERNLTNAAALEANRRRYHDEQQRAYAIHAFKERAHYSLREIYLREEPELVGAIREGDRGRARELLNRLLVTVHHHAGENLELLKSLFMELVVTMSRTAVEAGASPEETLGGEYAAMAQLAAISSDEELARWLRPMLERMMDTIRRRRRGNAGLLVSEALSYMQEHCGSGLTRDDVARAVHLSPSHFSHLLRRESGSTFTEILNRMRVDRAAELLVHTEKPLSLIALETGFSEQSYFTKVFKRHRGATPLSYRRRFARPGA